MVVGSKCFVLFWSPLLLLLILTFISHNEESKINVHLSSVEQTLPTFLSQREKREKNHQQRDSVLKFFSTAL